MCGETHQGKDHRAVVAGNRLTLWRENLFEEGWLIRLTTHCAPKSLDMDPEDNAYERLLGIYRLQGTTLTICVGVPGTARPTTFACGTRDYLVMVLKRRKD
jgi:uncharacterized protein (TIGR03067 family)